MNSKSIYCTKEHPWNLIVELDLNQNKTITESMFRNELQRLIDKAIEDGDNPIHQAVDQISMADYPTCPTHLIQSLMQEDAVYNIFRDIDGKQLVEAPDDLVEEYERRTFYSYLVEVIPDQNH